MACLRIPHGGITNNVIQKQPSSNYKLSTKVNATMTTTHDSKWSGLSLYTSDLGLERERSNISENDYTIIESTPRVSETETLDELIHSSVTEIVKNIKHAPLLVQIFTNGEVKTSKVSKDKNNWTKHRSSLSSLLEGVILVEELGSNGDEHDIDGARAYGVLIQGKVKGRDECKSTCYLLKTSSSENGGDLALGLGFCTHFCLMKVQSFHENVFKQFNDCWLLQ
ncbi:hypothetical protein CTI12_AA259280 [Artemisia annua]|uniref:DUF7804 domain-containing protein n=1 Tax=Artemisia annua TaxID=35608 RepID=A0A2U1NIX8_ARTAN|nr:hypothetical protein CTI12_AA259280 [Artemisia annua]